ncbi:unnamed protein product [Bursaphelenchus okinawaensis]|uniref:Choline/carnitine acyltransferase domain-containing protein n=1 Tax=Bursaphelenchus okinawaensis TaxID=465554 RepID=A0A811KBY8_9BILA|nr:unnamed protein product [Bursaphelenchus okinawaensis]CAG9097810.1 unnamed protein product [Bursaphelenchus okinawaensis]
MGRRGKRVVPFDMKPKFPTLFEQKVIGAKKFVHNTLYPLPPWVCSAIFISTLASQLYKTPISSIISLETVNSLYMSALATLAPLALAKLYLYGFVFRYKAWLFDNPKKPSLMTKLWGISFKMLQKLNPPKLYTCTHLLPRQPVPMVEDTVRGYLESIKTIVDKLEFDEIKAKADYFLVKEGPQLQKYAQFLSWTRRNYISDFWEKYIYLASREPLLINSSVGYGDGQYVKKCSMARRGAKHCHMLALNAMAFNNGNMKPTADGLCFTEMHHRIFTYNRIPQKHCDRFLDHGLTRHVLIMYNGCYYKVDVFDPKDNRVYSVAEIEAIFNDIIARADTPSPAEKNVASLTNDNRDKWAENRERFFLKNATNYKFLQDAETALFAMALDPNEYGDIDNDSDKTSEYMRVMTCGLGNDRWTDKPFNYHVTGCGRVGGTLEHGVCDGAEYRTVCETTLHCEDAYLDQDDYVLPEEKKSTIQLAKRMVIDEVPGLLEETSRCYEESVARANDMDLASKIFRDFGKGLIKKIKMHPRWILANGYSASLLQAKPQTLRSVGKESCEFVESVINDEDVSERKAKLLKACEAHSNKNKKVMVGKGVDRHLFVMYVLSKYKGMTSDFLEHYVSQKWTLSTTQPPNVTNVCEEDEHPPQSWMGGAFGAVDKNGYGVVYKFLGENAIGLHVSSYHSCSKTNSKLMRENILESLKEMVSYFEH